MKFKVFLSVGTLLSISISGCGGGVNSSDSGGGSSSPAGVNVYLAGISGSLGVSANSIATVWKNGATVSSASGTSGSSAYGIAVDTTGATSDLYTAGVTNFGGYLIATVWKNGVASNLTDGTSAAWAKAVAVFDTTATSDVYIAGWTVNPASVFYCGANWLNNGIATVWKNGVATKLTDGKTNAQANAIAISSSGDVYVAGYIANPTTCNTVATIWKNGVASNLTDGTTSAEANAIAISSVGDVYVAGITGAGGETIPDHYGIATVWKNGVAANLTTGTTAAEANAIAVSSSGDVYVAGTTGSTPTVIATVWKNGVATNLTTGKAYVEANAIAISSSGDVYVAGANATGDSLDSVVPTYWKNGTANNLPNSGGTATSIALSSQ